MMQRMQATLSQSRLSAFNVNSKRPTFGSLASEARLHARPQALIVIAAAGRAPTPSSASKRAASAPLRSEYPPLAVQLPNEEGCLWVGDLPSCQIEVHVMGASNPAAAAAVAQGVADNAAVCGAMLSGFPDWAAIADAASAADETEVERSLLRISVGGMPLLHHGHPNELASSASAYCREYLHEQIGRRGTVRVEVDIGEGPAEARASSSCTCRM